MHGAVAANDLLLAAATPPPLRVRERVGRIPTDVWHVK